MSSSHEKLLQEDLLRADFRIGVDKGYWAINEDEPSDWPFLYTDIKPASRVNGTEIFVVKWDLTGYNANPPNGAFWDTATHDYLPIERWPKGKSGSVVEGVFKTAGWTNPGKGFYHPFDRTALNGHHDWPRDNPAFIWGADNTITDFICLVHRWLNSEEYIGC